jgi:D-tagatose-1,6-bisphosphate aldolase subunit GatZ/KbaZ
MRQVLEKAMLVRPDHWRSHYRGSEAEVRYLRSYSLRDRIRYYWSAPAVTQALAQLLANLAPPVPTALVRQYFPELFPALDRGELAPDPRELIRGRIEAALTPYLQACRQADQPRSASSGT